MRVDACGTWAGRQPLVMFILAACVIMLGGTVEHSRALAWCLGADMRSRVMKAT